MKYPVRCAKDKSICVYDLNSFFFIKDAKVESLHVAYPTHNKQQLERQL